MKIKIIVWKWIPNYEGLYQVSTSGNVRSVNRKVKHRSGGDQLIKGRLLKAGRSVGYPFVCLSKKGKHSYFKVHKLVLEAFIGPCPKGPSAAIFLTEAEPIVI